MQIEEMKVRVTFTEELLATASAKPDIHREFIASAAPDAKTREEEVAAIGADEVADREMTVFPRTEDGTPFLYDYQWKGFFKESCQMLRRAPGTVSKEAKGLKAFKKVIDGLVFVKERKVPLLLDGKPLGPGEIGSCQRPLRAQTAQGERVALAESESAPAGCTAEFTVAVYDPELLEAVREWLDYGAVHGTGQWRNSGKGRFTWEEIA